MSHNLKKICLQCGRMFNAYSSKHAFCSLECKRRYSNHLGYRCRECRNVNCKIRDNSLINSPPGCENLGAKAKYSDKKKK